MKLIRFGEPAKERPGLLLNDGTFIDTSGFRPTRVFDYDEEFFAGDGLAQLRESTHHRGHAAARVSHSVRLSPPIDRPSKIVCRSQLQGSRGREQDGTSEEPVIFFKSTTSLVGPNDPLVIPRGATKVDWEVRSCRGNWQKGALCLARRCA
jgi:2,4-diketo-3-deoxy-L-fuconate hydrolase